MQELDFLKLILLSKDQLKLLNFVSKPSVSLIHKDDYLNLSDNELDSSKSISSQDLNVSDIKKLFTVYKNLLKKPNKDSIDKKLIFLFKNEMKQLIK
jgi:hypothetical protein